MPALEHVADIRVDVPEPLDAGDVFGLMTRGRRRLIPIVGGSVSGPHFSGTLLPGGADFQMTVSPTCSDVDARYIMRLNSPGLEGQHVYVENVALRRAGATDLDAPYLRFVARFEVSCAELQWLTESIFIGTGAKVADHILLSVFRVT